jgi:hypothetical protein
MDQHKIEIPRLIELVKYLSSACISVLIDLTGCLVHVYGLEAYHHFSVIGLHKSDSSAIVTSLAKVLRDLENWNEERSGDLAFCPNNNTKGIF